MVPRQHAAELDDREPAGLDRRPGGGSTGLDDLHTGKDRGTTGEVEDVLRAAGKARADVGAAGDLGAAAEDRGRIGDAAAVP